MLLFFKQQLETHKISKYTVQCTYSLALLSFTSGFGDSEQTRSAALGLGGCSHSRTPGSVPAAAMSCSPSFSSVSQAVRGCRLLSKGRANVSAEDWARARKGQGRGMSTVSSGDG